MVGTMFLSMRQYFGEPIECLNRSQDISQQLLQNYCWLEGSFSVVDSTGRTAVGESVAYPGVKTLSESAGERKQQHKYYQWVYFILIIQSIMFYVPKYLWKAKEAKRLKMLICHLSQRNIKDYSELDRKKLTQDVFDSILISSDYFFFFFFCEFLYYIHLIMQMWFVNIFLSGQFLRLGYEWLLHSSDGGQDPLIRVFPRFTKCTFHKYGYSGSLEASDALCFLSLNIVNEKIYVVLWFWFGFLFIITSLGLINRILIVLFPKYRYFKLQKQAPSTDKKILKRLCNRVGNWFILYYISSYMKPSHFRDLIDYLVKEHFDKNCNLIIGNNKADSMTLSNGKQNKINNMNLMNGMGNMGKMMAPNNAMNPMMPSAPTNTNSKKKSSKNVMKNSMYYVRNGGKNTNFVSVNRDPPSGQSGESRSDSDDPINLG